MKPSSPESVADQYRAGVGAIVHTADQLANDHWDLPACGEWTATETARHVLAVARWYHAWLDRALDGETSRPFPPAKMEERNAAELTALTHLDGPSAAALFAASARDYLERTRDT